MILKLKFLKHESASEFIKRKEIVINNIKFVKVTGSDWERSLNVTTSNANRLEVNVSDIPSGSYHVTVSNKNGISAWQTLTIVSVPTIITPPVVTPSEKEVRITNPATPPPIRLLFHLVRKMVNQLRYHGHQQMLPHAF